MSEKKTLVAVYCRVSSDDQRDRETIRTQQDVAESYLATHDDLEVYRWYLDDGVSGTIPMSQRHHGGDLLRDATAGCFQVILVVRPDRLGRNEIDLLQLYTLFERLGIALVGISEPIGDQLMFGIKALLSGDERRKFLARSAEGMSRAAKEGRYCGGIVAFGFRVEGAKEKARLIPDEHSFWGECSAAEVVRRIYGWLVEGKSCYWIADHLNVLGVPTHYQRDGRLLKDSQGRRTRATQGTWRPGRVCNLVKNPLYKGELSYGRRSARDRDVIVASIPAIVPPEIWEAAQRALVGNRIMRRRAKRVNILRSVIRCSICGLNYSAAAGRDDVVWLRCGGQTAYRGKIEGRCAAKSIKYSDLGPIVLRDIEGFLRNPGDILDELASERSDGAIAAVAEAERVAIEAALTTIPRQRKVILERVRLGKISEAECDEQLDDIARIEEAQRRRLAELCPVDEPEDVADPDLLAEVRKRLDDGLDDLLWQELVQHLVRRIVVHTELLGGGKKRATIRIEYRFFGVAQTDTGTGSSPPPA